MATIEEKPHENFIANARYITQKIYKVEKITPLATIEEKPDENLIANARHITQKIYKGEDHSVANNRGKAA